MSQEIEVGQRWYVFYPGSRELTEVIVHEITEKTICLKHDLWGLTAWGPYPAPEFYRYIKPDVTFIELLPPQEEPPVEQKVSPPKKTLFQRFMRPFGRPS